MRARLPLLAPGALALAAGLWAGLSRLGWALPSGPASPEAHGPLMISGFLGTVISLERAVALRRPWAYAAPALAGLGSLGLLLGTPAAAVLLSLASAWGVALYAPVLRTDPAPHHRVMALGALAWLAGNLAWAAGAPVFAVVPAWTAFLVLTIAGERLELGRLLPPGRGARAGYVVGVGLLALSLPLGLLERDLAFRLGGLGEVALAAWLLRCDVARRTVRQPGLVRFIALCLLAGYAWLGAGGALALALGNPAAGPRYDALLHMVFVGFVLSMIFGHAPVIVPAVLGVRIEFHRRFYAHLALLHASLLLRVVGDVLGVPALRRAGGLGNALAVAVFLVSTLAAVRRASARPGLALRSASAGRA